MRLLLEQPVRMLAETRGLNALAAEIQAMGRNAAVVKADVSEKDDVESMIEFVGETFGRLDIVVSNAATGGFRPLLASTARNFHATYDTNVLALRGEFGTLYDHHRRRR